MRCKAKNKLGEPCSAAAVRDTKHCVMHSGRAAEIGTKGGRRRAIYNPENLEEFPPPKTAADLRDLLAQSIIEIRSGNSSRNQDQNSRVSLKSEEHRLHQELSFVPAQ
jgi:hypothetical protein